MRVKLLAPLGDKSAGDEAELSSHQAIGLMELGFAVPAKPKIERAVKRPVETRKRK